MRESSCGKGRTFESSRARQQIACRGRAGCVVIGPSLGSMSLPIHCKGSAVAWLLVVTVLSVPILMFAYPRCRCGDCKRRPRSQPSGAARSSISARRPYSSPGLVISSLGTNRLRRRNSGSRSISAFASMINESTRPSRYMECF
jgi:hypothetical protein